MTNYVSLLPYDLFYALLMRVSPKDILRFSSTSRHYRSLLYHCSSRNVWAQWWTANLTEQRLPQGSADTTRTFLLRKLKFWDLSHLCAHGFDKFFLKVRPYSTGNFQAALESAIQGGHLYMSDLICGYGITYQSKHITLALTSGHLSLALELVSRGIAMDQLTEMDLYHVVRGSHLEVLKWYHQCVRPLNDPNSMLLLHAFYSGNKKMIDFVRDLGGNIRSKSNLLIGDFFTLDTPSRALLIECGFDIPEVIDSLLIRAVELNRVDILWYLFLHHDGLLTVQRMDLALTTCLSLISSRYISMLSMLLDCYPEYTSNMKLMSYLCRLRDEASLERYFPVPNFRYSAAYLSTVLIYAIQYGNIPLVQRLIRIGVNPNSGNGMALLLAIRERQTIIVRTLLKAGACPDVQRHSPLFMAIFLGLRDMVTLLFEYDVTLECVSNSYAIVDINYNRAIPSIKLVWKTFNNYDKISPLNCAVRNRDALMVNLLVQHGAVIPKSEFDDLHEMDSRLRQFLESHNLLHLVELNKAKRTIPKVITSVPVIRSNLQITGAPKRNPNWAIVKPLSSSKK